VVAAGALVVAVVAAGAFVAPDLALIVFLHPIIENMAINTTINTAIIMPIHFLFICSLYILSLHYNYKIHSLIIMAQYYNNNGEICSISEV